MSAYIATLKLKLLLGHGHVRTWGIFLADLVCLKLLRDERGPQLHPQNAPGRYFGLMEEFVS